MANQNQDIRTRYGASQRHFTYGNYSNPVFQYPLTHSLVAANASPVFIQAPSEKGLAGVAINFLMDGVSAVVSKTVAAPIERVKLLVQNQDEMIKSGRLSEPHKGVGDCFSRTIKEKGVMSLWRGNTVNVLRYFPTQALNFAFKDYIKSLFKSSASMCLLLFGFHDVVRERGEIFGKNIEVLPTASDEISGKESKRRAVTKEMGLVFSMLV